MEVLNLVQKIQRSGTYPITVVPTVNWTVTNPE